MSRPVDPNWSVGSWATNTNYAAGSNPWNNNPIKVQHPSPAGGFVPGQGVGAGYVNYELNRIYTTQTATKTHVQALTSFVGQIPALTWVRTVTSVASHNFVMWNLGNQTFYVVGNTENVRSSLDGGLTWTGAGSDVASAMANENCIYADYDASGNVVVATDTRYVAALDASTGTWTKVDVGASSLPTGNRCRVVHDPVSAKWVWVYDALGTSVVKYSSDRSSWTANVTSLGTGLLEMACKRSTGKILYVSHNLSGQFTTQVTSDGGVNFTLTSITTTSAFTPTDARLAYSAESDVWIYTVSNASASQVWISTNDGTSWTQVSALSAAKIYGMACLGELWCALAFIGARDRIIYSTDRGATWRLSGVSVTGTPKGVFECGGGFVAVTSSNLYFSSRTGKPSFGLAT